MQWRLSEPVRSARLEANREPAASLAAPRLLPKGAKSPQMRVLHRDCPMNQARADTRLGEMFAKRSPARSRRAPQTLPRGRVRRSYTGARGSQSPTTVPASPGGTRSARDGRLRELWAGARRIPGMVRLRRGRRGCTYSERSPLHAYVLRRSCLALRARTL